MSLKRKIYDLEFKLSTGQGSIHDMDELDRLNIELDIQNLREDIEALPKDGTLETLERKGKMTDRIIELSKQIGTWEN